MQTDVQEVAQLAKGSPVSPQNCLQVIEFFKAQGVPVWLMGGWALQAWTGIERPHGDVDLLTHEEHRPFLEELLRKDVQKNRSHKLAAEVRGAPVDLVFAVRTARGKLVSYHPKLIMNWPPDLFEHSHTGKLCGMEVPIVHPVALLVQITHTVGKDQSLLDKNARDRATYKGSWSTDDEKRAPQYLPVANTWWNLVRTRLFS